MTGFLLDTNVLSELRRPSPSANVLTFMASQPLHRFYVSSVVFAEIRFGIEQVASPARRTELQEWLTNRLRPLFEGRCLAVTEDIMLKWRLLVEEGNVSGTPSRSRTSSLPRRPCITVSPSFPATPAISKRPAFLC